MKIRMVLIAAAVFVFACTSFAQQGFSVFLYNDCYMLTSDCGDGAPLPDGTPVEIRWDQNSNGFDAGDPLAPLCAQPPDCPGGPAGTVNFNTFALNGGAQSLGLGYFACENNFTSVGTISPARFYLVIRCADGSPHYVAGPLTFAPGPQEVDVCQWQCFPCGPPPPCEQSEDVVIQAAQYGWVMISHCLHLCLEQTTLVHICSLTGHPLLPEMPPISEWHPGCMEPNNCYNPDCPPTAAIVIGPVYNSATGCWDYAITLWPGAPEGCICFIFEGFEAASLDRNSFAAVAGNNMVTLGWTTLAEAEVASFAVVRDGALIGLVTAENSVQGATYSYTDHTAVNGRTYTYTLRVVNADNTVNETGLEATATPSPLHAVITEYALHQNFPNPFNPETQITFDLLETGHATLNVYNLTGQEVATPVNGERSAGRQVVTFNAGQLPSGVYLYRLNVNGFSATQKMVLMK